MKHMETASEAEERRKVMRFSHGMNAFVEGKTNFTPEDTMLKINRGTKDRTGSDEKFEASRKVSSSRSAKDPVSLVSQRASGNTPRDLHMEYSLIYLDRSKWVSKRARIFSGGI